MYLMYVDESGDTGLVSSPTRYFVLSGLIVHELRWRDCLEKIISFRRRINQIYGLRLRDEIHASNFINSPGKLIRIRKNERLMILRHFADELAGLPYLNFINVITDKANKPTGYDVFNKAWTALIQRFENTLANRNFPSMASQDDQGLIFSDHTDDKKLIQLLRRMRRYNPVPSIPEFGGGYRNIALGKIIEDPSFRDSSHSYFIRAADLSAYLLYQQTEPNAYMRSKGGRKFFSRLAPILCRVASPRDPQGVVRL